MEKEYYVPKYIEKTRSVEVFGQLANIDMSWADGMIGVLPVFDNELEAKRYSGDSGYIILKEDK